MPLCLLALKMEMSFPFILLPPLIFFFLRRLSPIRLQLPKKGNGCVIKACQLGGHYHSLWSGSVGYCLLCLCQHQQNPQTYSPLHLPPTWWRASWWFPTENCHSHLTTVLLGLSLGNWCPKGHSLKLGSPGNCII